MLSPQILDRLSALQPETAGELKIIEAMAQRATDPALLGLCTAYMEAALNCRDWRPPESGLSEREQAFIHFTEQFVTSVSSLGHDTVTGLLEHASADEVYAFVHALYVTDMSLRLSIVGQEVLV